MQLRRYHLPVALNGQSYPILNNLLVLPDCPEGNFWGVCLYEWIDKF